MPLMVSLHQELWWGLRGPAVGRSCHGSQSDESCTQRYWQAVDCVSPPFWGSFRLLGCASFKNQLWFQTDWLALKPLKAVGLFILVKGIVPIYLKFNTLLQKDPRADDDSVGTRSSEQLLHTLSAL